MSYKSNIAILPGKTLALILSKAGMSQTDLATRADLSEKHISQIINGKAVITLETALKFERVLGGVADFWISLEKKYQEDKIRLEQNEKIVDEIKIAEKYPYKELTFFGYVSDSKDKYAKVWNLLKFFAVDSLKIVKTTEPVAFRKMETEKVNKEALAAWLRLGEIEAKKIEVDKFDKSALKNLLDDIKELTFLPDGFGNKLKVRCAEVGIIVIFTPYFKNTYVNGAVRWIGENPVIQLTIRNKFSDIFWFTFFHEIGHILLHGKKDQFVEFEEGVDEKLDFKKEIEANDFASNYLIDADEYKRFVKAKNFSVVNIMSFAKVINVDASVLAGRLAHDRLVGWNKIASLRKKLDLKSAI